MKNRLVLACEVFCKRQRGVERVLPFRIVKPPRPGEGIPLLKNKKKKTEPLHDYTSYVGRTLNSDHDAEPMRE
jgi:hypothetical protein